jgi:hypothetical protein
MTYKPGQPQLHEGEWNVWPGWGCEPKAGSVKLWHTLTNHLFNGSKKDIEWVENWAAYMIQNPGAKMYSAILLWGNKKGTGKTMIAYHLMRIFGRNAVEIKNKDLKGTFNSWAENRQFVYGDEITGDKARVDADWLKGLITNDTVRINAKYMPEYSIPDCMNYFFTSNHPDALFLEDGDRRFFIWEVTAGPLPRSFYEEYDAWLKGEGSSNLMHYLLNKDLSGFNPREHAPMTDGKRNMTFNGKSDHAVWCATLKENTEVLLRPLGDEASKGCDLFTATQLLKAYCPEGNTKVSVPGIARELVRSGFPPVNGGAPIRLSPDLGTTRLFIVRNVEKWLTAAPKEMADHYVKFFGNPRY